MNFLRFFIVMMAVGLSSLNIQAQGLKAFKLPNGMSVFIWEDATKPDVMGMVVVKAGSKDDPEEYTGLAHYLEHMLFKGTQKIGTTDWAKEKPIYEQIVKLYDQRAAEKDAAKKEEITKEINRLSIEESKFVPPTEFANLSEGVLGGNALNANTWYDRTVYHNVFSPEEINRWLELNSQRLINPVFRGFQSELETVYEEYNMYQDDQNNQNSEFMMSKAFAGHPYERPIIGLGNHLKNPQLSKLIEFYNTWYVPDNMALILAGNVKTDEILPRIKTTFGKLPRKTPPVPKQYPETPYKGRKVESDNHALYPTLYMIYQGITPNSPDRFALDICTQILSSNSNTGLLNKLTIEGDMLLAHAEVRTLKERGRIILAGVPSYDVSQMRFGSLKDAEKMMLAEVKKLKEGQFDEALVNSIKGELIRGYDLNLESSDWVVNTLADLYYNDSSPDDFLNYKNLIGSVTMEQIKTVANKYFGNNYLVVQLNKGKKEKGDKISKPKLDALDPPHNARSMYALQLASMPIKRKPVQYADMNAVKTRQINDRSKLFYTKNPINEVFTLTLKYGVGTDKMPKLRYAANLMNSAGIMGTMKAQDFQKAMSALGANCYYSVDDNYLYVRLSGFETNLAAICNLMTRQILIPELDEKQMNSMLGSEYQMRVIEKEQVDEISSAMMDYMVHKDKSEYIDRMPMKEVLDLTVSNLTGEFQRATGYEAQVFYVGSKPMDEVYDILSKNLPLKQGELASTSPEIKPIAENTENTVYFTPNTDAKQSAIYFYIDGDNTAPGENQVLANAFSVYFGGGFNGLMMQEVREYRSMAYTAAAAISRPPVAGKKEYFIGYVGTQADNTNKAVDLVMSMIRNMPEYPERINTVKNYLRQNTITRVPSFRNAAQTYEAWKLLGYDKPIAEVTLPFIEKLTFDDIVNFYKKNIQNAKISIGIVGNPKEIDLKALEKYGKVVKMSSDKLFSNEKVNVEYPSN